MVFREKVHMPIWPKNFFLIFIDYRDPTGIIIGSNFSCKRVFMLKPGTKNGDLTVLDNNVKNREITAKCGCGSIITIPTKNFRKRSNCGCIGKGSWLGRTYDEVRALLKREEETNTKYCNKCEQFKSRDRFYVSKDTKGYRYGLATTCTDCVREYCKKTRDRARLTRKDRILKDPLHHVATYLFASARCRARDKKIPFTITHEWVLERIRKGICEVTNKPFSYDKDTNHFRRPLGPSIDQILPSKGYTPSNARVVCNWFNIAKSDLTDEEFFKLIKTLPILTPIT